MEKNLHPFLSLMREEENTCLRYVKSVLRNMPNKKRKVSSDPLFKGERLKEFFPKYANIEYFFTGMFVENLLWNEKVVKKASEEPKPKISDFEVEIY